VKLLPIDPQSEVILVAILAVPLNGLIWLVIAKISSTIRYEHQGKKPINRGRNKILE
jgi:hypothetical protein